LKDNFTLWQIDLNQIMRRKKAAGHYFEGMDKEDDEDGGDE
jgi:hypothetical protein